MRLLRNKTTYTFSPFDLSRLQALSKRVVDINIEAFTSEYGNILFFMHSGIDDQAVNTLLQFYDPEIWCFTLRDYQLAPTFEEYSSLLKIPIKEEVPFVSVPEEPDFQLIANTLYLGIREVKEHWSMEKSGAYGIPLKFLADKADYYANNGSWVIFIRLVAMMVYGAVLFPDVENLIGLAAICIFIGRNLVPIILVDTYYAIHSQHGKRGAVVCCLPLLYKWFLIHLPVKGPFIEIRGTLKWSKRVMDLTSFDITWANVMHVTEMITSCGEFYNVPLMGTKWCINYNPVLAIHQLGFAFRDEPKA
ncbi:uncharacterized protein LOC127136252 [Lathyrus oleraceus]|uniref:uncharacterized protein LOC127136252 n=1 Tax=Pisum sativum TaxID=3888 RepID=UPI0021D2BD36|nr:uncharacterized protein LOC127136252 [Pisum sativum]